MSSRHLRKVVGNTDLPPAEEGDDNYEPLYAQNNSQPKYSGLLVTSESEKGSPSEKESEPEEVIIKPKSRKNKRKNGKKAKSKGNKESNAFELDEIDKCLKEVNDLLGAPPEPSTSKQMPVTHSYPDVMQVTRATLNVNTELKRLFGPTPNANKRKDTHYKLVLKKVYVMPLNDTVLYEYTRKGGYGVSMSIYHRENDVVYFAYEHNKERQDMHRHYLRTIKRREPFLLLDWDSSRINMHVEALLEVTDGLFRHENYGLAIELIENIITFLQTVAHPSFNLASDNVRLEYNIWENRPFHVAVLKYIYLLTNKACHRTALELAKMLLNIDPSDPLAVLFIIDSLAIRARAHEWLIEAFDYFQTLRQAGLLFNLLYSRALAMYHVATKKKDDLKVADSLLQDAILAYPMVVTMMFKYANINNTRITTHELFAREPLTMATEGLNILMFIYARLCYSRFREPGVVDWLIRNATEVADGYDNNEEIKNHAKDMIQMRHSLFRMSPIEVIRHLGVIKNMAPLIFEESLPLFRRETCGWDPLQDGGINRYGYRTLIDPPLAAGPAGSSFYRFFTSMLPSYNINEPPPDN